MEEDQNGGQNQEKIVNVLKVIFKNDLQKHKVLKDIVNEAYGPNVHVFDDSSMTEKYMAQSAGFDIYKVKVDSQQDLRDGKAKYSFTVGTKNRINTIYTEKNIKDVRILRSIKNILDNRVIYDFSNNGPYNKSLIVFVDPDDKFIMRETSKESEEAFFDKMCTALNIEKKNNMSENQTYHKILQKNKPFMVAWQVKKLCLFYFDPLEEHANEYFQQYITQKIKIRKTGLNVKDGFASWALMSRSGKVVARTNGYNLPDIVLKDGFFDLMKKLKATNFEGLDKLKALKQIDDEFDLDPEEASDKQEKRDNQDNKGNQGGTLCSIS